MLPSSLFFRKWLSYPFRGARVIIPSLKPRPLHSTPLHSRSFAVPRLSRRGCVVSATTCCSKKLFDFLSSGQAVPHTHLPLPLPLPFPSRVFCVLAIFHQVTRAEETTNSSMMLSFMFTMMDASCQPCFLCTTSTTVADFLCTVR